MRVYLCLTQQHDLRPGRARRPDLPVRGLHRAVGDPARAGHRGQHPADLARDRRRCCRRRHLGDPLRRHAVLSAGPADRLRSRPDRALDRGRDRHHRARLRVRHARAGTRRGTGWAAASPGRHRRDALHRHGGASGCPPWSATIRCWWRCPCCFGVGFGALRPAHRAAARRRCPGAASAPCCSTVGICAHALHGDGRARADAEPAACRCRTRR